MMQHCMTNCLQKNCKTVRFYLNFFYLPYENWVRIIASCWLYFCVCKTEGITPLRKPSACLLCQLHRQSESALFLWYAHPCVSCSLTFACHFAFSTQTHQCECWAKLPNIVFVVHVRQHAPTQGCWGWCLVFLSFWIRCFKEVRSEGEGRRKRKVRSRCLLLDAPRQRDRHVMSRFKCVYVYMYICVYIYHKIK